MPSSPLIVVRRPLAVLLRLLLALVMVSAGTGVVLAGSAPAAYAGETTLDGKVRFRYTATPKTVTPGSTVTYRYEFTNLTSNQYVWAYYTTNPSTGAYRRATLSDSGCSGAANAAPSTGTGWTLDASGSSFDYYLEPGQTGYLECTAQVTATTTSTASLTGIVYTSSSLDRSTASVTQSTSTASTTETVTVSTTAYTLEGTATPSSAQPGEAVTLKATLKNTSASAGGPYTFSATLPSSFDRVASLDGCTVSGRTVTCSGQAGLAANASRTYQITAYAGTTTGTSNATLSVTTTSGSGGNPTATVPMTIAAATTGGVSGDGDFTLTKTPSRTTVPSGGAEVTYTYTVKNNRTDRRQYYYGAADDKCSPLTYQSGLARIYDYTADRYFYYIPAGGTATWRCIDTITQTTVNKARFSFADSYYVSYYYGVVYEGTSSATATATVTRTLPTSGYSTSCDTVWFSTSERTPTVQGNGIVGYVDRTTGALKPVFDIGTATGNPDDGSAALAMDPTDPTQLYFIPRTSTATTSLGTGLWRYDLKSSTATMLTAAVPDGGRSGARLGMDPRGDLWTISAFGNVFRYRPSDTALGWVDMGRMTIPSGVGAVSDLLSGDLAFDGNGTMYFITANSNRGQQVSYLLSVSAAELADGTPTAKLAGRMGGSLAFNGLALTDDGQAYGSTQMEGVSALHRVSLHTGAPTQVTEYPNELLGDLASCALPTPTLQVTKSVSPYGPVVAGTRLTYTITVENTGTLAATSATLQDIPEGGRIVSATLNGGPELGSRHFNTPRPINAGGDLPGVIGPGERATITLKVDVDPGRRQVCNQSRTTYEGSKQIVLSDDTSLPDAADKTCTAVFDPHIMIDVTGSTTQLNSNGKDTDVTYSYAVTNAGNEPLVNLQVTDNECSPLVRTGGDVNGDGILTDDETWTYTCTRTLTGTLEGGRKEQNTGTATGTGTETKTVVTDTDVFTVYPPGMTFRKTSDTRGRHVAVGDVITYTIQATNTWDETHTLTNVTITDALPPGMTYVGGSATRRIDSGGTTVAAHAPSGLVTAADGVSLGYGETLVVTYRVTVTSAPADTATNKAVGDSVETEPVEDSVTERVLTPQLDLVKYPGVLTGPDQDGIFTVTYTIRVANPGSGTATYGPITDTLQFDPTLRPVDATWTGRATGSAPLSGPSDSFTIGAAETALKAGQDHTYDLTIRFTRPGSTPTSACGGAGTATTNTVALPAGQETSGDGDNVACVAPVASFEVKKAADGGPSGGIGKEVQATFDRANNRVEAVATYVITVTNRGLVAANQPAVTDTATVPTGFTIDKVTVDGTDQATTNGTFTIPAGTVPVAVDGATTYRVVLTAQASAPSTLDWATAGSCVARDDQGLTGGLANGVWADLVNDLADNNQACVPITPPTAAVTVLKRGLNCDVAANKCPLPGARFALYDRDPTTAGATPVVNGITVDSTDATRFTTPGLTYYTRYWLVETAAPDGHTLLPRPVEFSLTDQGVTLAGAADARLARVDGSTDTLTVLDPTAAALPATGGRGWWVPFTGGSLLIVGGLLLGSARRVPHSWPRR